MFACSQEGEGVLWRCAMTFVLPLMIGGVAEDYWVREGQDRFPDVGA